MKERSIYIPFMLIISIVCLKCTNSFNSEEKLKKEFVQYYSTKFNFQSEPKYDFIFDPITNDSIHRYYWELENKEIRDLLKKFEIFNSDTFLDNKTFKYFMIVFDKGGRILEKGLLNDDLKLTGVTYQYLKNDLLIKKNMYKLDNKFYEVFYQLDSVESIIDSSYTFHPIVQFDVDTFEGPFLSVCFDVQIIINNDKYSYEDFQLFYVLYDTRYYKNTKLIDGQRDRILEDLSQESSDGYYFFCHDLEVKYHLMMAFGVLVDPGISDQDLSFGNFHGPIINKNIDSTDL
jgi:hypothetical protein